MRQSQMLRRDPDADELADSMLAARRTMAEVLEETLTPTDDGGIVESGRTVCGNASDLKEPLSRFPEAVDLQECKVGRRTGTYHAHVTAGELRSPEHSLPDMCNVVFGSVDTSVVVGVETSDLMVAADSDEAMRDRFQNVLGLEVQNTAEIVDALESGEISDPTSARQRVREEMAPLFETVSTPFPDLQGEVERLLSSDTISSYSPSEGASGIMASDPMYSVYLDSIRQQNHGHSNDTRPQKIRSRTVSAKESASSMGTYVAQTAASSAIGMATRNALRNAFF